jgi:folate-binding Fe-S cluster repair protein YgfZ
MSVTVTRDELAGPINWNLLDPEQAEAEWRDLDRFVLWLKTVFGLSPAIVPLYWHRHDELIWELSALHLHFLACYDDIASPSSPIAWMREFAEARHRLREWVSICGTRIDRDRPTRQSTWPGEHHEALGSEVMIEDRAADFEEFVHTDVLRRRHIQADIDHQLLG